jgi:hypothetical protein
MCQNNRLRTARSMLASGPLGRRESVRDLFRQGRSDPGISKVVEACTSWLLTAQENSSSRDGGVASHYSLRDGWASSYPETTGYIIPTLLDLASRSKKEHLRSAALRMLEWLRSIQFEDGSFQGGNIDATPCEPVVFNTGQILFGLSAGVVEWGDAYAGSMKAAADWLVHVQDEDGAWRKFRSPFTTSGPKAYEAHVAWALLDADRVAPGRGYGTAGLRNIRFAISRQTATGWFEDCGLGENELPITHTIGYVLRGIIEGWRYSGEKDLLAAACKCANAICTAIGADGWLPGMFDRNWNPAANWVCVTGSAQLAHCLILLFMATGEKSYLDSARRLNRFVRSTVHVTGPRNLAGGVKGSFPVYGKYGPFRLLNWAAKFTIDSNLAEQEVDNE